MCDSSELGSMTEDEDRMAVEAHIRTLYILQDALKKKELLLAEPGRDYGPEASNVPFISPRLVEDLLEVLQQVVLLKQNQAEIGANYPTPSASVIGLPPDFWKRHENLRVFSRPGALIMAAACILENRYHGDKRLMEENGSSDANTGRVCEAFEAWMRHKGEYVDGSYICCGETSVHSVCEDSDLRLLLHCKMNEEQEDIAEASRWAALDVLCDARKKNLLVDTTHLMYLQQTHMGSVPLITRTLLENLILKLQVVTFKCDNKPRNETLSAYPDRRGQDVIYLCPFFWNQKNRLSLGSRLGTLILCASRMLGYRSLLDGSSPPEDPKELSADDICSAFESWMMHKQPYTEGSYPCCGETKGDSVCSYPCCGETKGDSVCSKSVMGEALRQDLPLVVKMMDGDDPRSCSRTVNWGTKLDADDGADHKQPLL
ncbi:hypothetical protein GDO81_020576 [Engystomops pustulosus]|uniref:Uncharacterized protein n=1 Tax=Engystomops pustulosus TaxID=76066 RepID=A0AAV6ZGH8_ENGPU|nr:hypothetical protein GDO81_020576 [Engystomops pustulosus]